MFCGPGEFVKLEQDALDFAGFPSKPLQQLTILQPLTFNGGLVTLHDDLIILTQKKYCERIVDVKTQDGFVKQRALGAYIATLSQPEASYDLAIAAQVARNPSAQDMEALNKRLQWQKRNASRVLRFVPLDLAAVRLYCFVDASFTRNQDLSSQLGIVLVLADQVSRKSDHLTIQGNLIHWLQSSAKESQDQFLPPNFTP